MNDDIVFDTASGFSEEEQREILREIDSLSGENRIAAPPEALAAEAKKRGVLFPVLVNLGALLLLASGFFLLMYFHSHEEADIRGASAVLGLTERRLIQEIRRETSRQISEKEKEINDYLSKLSEADAEYKELQVSVESLTEEQKERAAYLLRLQDEYRGTLTNLQEERAKILEDSRSREIELRAQAQERAGELASRIEQSDSALNAALEELGRLSSEQEKAAGAESQLAGFYQRVNESITLGDFASAAALLQSMREFLAAPSLQGIRSLERGRQAHLAAIASLELGIAESLKAETAAPAPASETDASGGDADAIAALEETIRQQRETIAALSAQDSEAGRLAAGYEERIGALQDQVSNQQQTLNQRDASLSELAAQLETQREQLTEQDRRLVALQGQVENLNRTIAANETTIAELRQQNEALARQVETFRSAAQQLLQQ
jgi:chromosome segregation ATPase